MKFSAASLVLVTSFAAASGAEWSSFFKGADTEDSKPNDTNEASGALPVKEEDEHVLNLMQRSRERRGLQVVDKNNNAVPTKFAAVAQTFYMPLPEKDVFNDLLKPIADTNSCSGDMVSMISIAISTDNTVIWYDHWEDGYDTALVKGAYSEVWGDGNAANGCRPDVVKCKDADDYLNAGNAIVIKSTMDNQRSESGASAWSKEGIKYDGRDKLSASYPVAVTRGEYATTPGSLLAGAVEVHDTEKWGTMYHAPVGQDTKLTTTGTFEWTRVFLMAKEPNTIVYLPDGTVTNLQEGASYSFSVKEGDRWTTSAPVQADICAGDVGSNYEMRWFSLLPVESWSDSYFSPMGDSQAFTSLVVYNPQDTPIVVTLKYRPPGSNQLKSYAYEDYNIKARSAIITRFIPTGSAGLLTLKSGAAKSKYVVLSITDTQTKDASGEVLNGQCYDWGFPVVPVTKLTPHVLIGWGYGCTDNKCDSLVERSAVWISPIEDADIYVDYQNTGKGYQKVPMKALESRMFRDKIDTDMSGAVIFATQVNSGPDGPPIDIAAAWGQDPAVSRDYQSYSLDLGTTVLPFSTLRAKKTVDKVLAKPGEILTYSIQIQNVGQTAVMAGNYTIFDPMMGQATYVEGSTKYSDNGGATYFAVPDDIVGSTKYPLDESGLKSQRDLPRRGGIHYVQFKVLVDPVKVMAAEMVNTGWVEPPQGGPIGFKAVTKLVFEASINVENTVYIGDSGEAGCSAAVESVTNPLQSVVTYCFTITNTGNTYLDWVTLVNEDLSIPATEFTVPKLAPNDYVVFTKKGKILGDLVNEVTATGWPVFFAGDTIPDLNQVSATDDSEVLQIAAAASVNITNTVYKGHDGSVTCSVAGVEKVFAKPGDPVTYCFKVTNTGNTHLSKIKITNPIVDNYVSGTVVDLAPNASVTVSYAGAMPDLANDSDNNLENMAKVVATPALASGVALGIPNVSSEDPSSVGNVVAGQTMSGDKPPYEDPDQPNCMEDAWEDANNSQNLVCRAKEVFINEGGIHAKERKSCDLNSMITITVDASVHFNSARYDPGWYVAQDGGDALRGQCAIAGLTVGNSYNVKDGYGADAKTVGSVAWNKDFKGGNDMCGDVMTNGGGGADILVPFMKAVEVKCVDQNDDGVLDVSVCFSWRVAGKDSKCTLTMEGAEGNVPDLFPGTPSKCFCARYDIPEITVVKPDVDDHISPC